MSRRILLADDSVTIQKVIELTFMDGDYEVRAVGNGDEAIALLESVDPEVVIADVHMPGANGYEVARRAKALRRDRPVLLLVGTFEPFDEAEARASGADRHLKKPFDSQELLQIVDDLLASGSPALLAPAPPTFSDDPFPGLSPAAPLATPSAAPANDPFGGFGLPPTREADPFPGFASPPVAPVEHSSSATPTVGDVLDVAGEPVFSFAEEPEPGVEPEYLPPAEPVWSTFEVEAEGTELPPLDEADLGLRIEPEPVFDLSAEGEPLVAEPVSAWTPPAAAPSISPASASAAPPSAIAPATPAAPTAPAADYALTDVDVDRIARRVIELIGDRPVRDIAWEVIPDLAEVVIRDRIRELEAAVDA